MQDLSTFIPIQIPGFFVPAGKSLNMQGITTEIIGNCGGSAVDISEDGRGRGELEKAGVTELWNGVKGYLDTVNKIGPAVNVGALFGHGYISKLIEGNDGRPLTPDELDRMEIMAEELMAQGALGVSSGLEYVPGRCANVEELSAISKGVAKYNGIHASHIRNEGPQLIGSVQEVVEVAKSSGVRMEVSHLKACGPTNWGKVKTALEIMDNNGVTADFYPYLASSTELAIVLPDWVVADGKEAGVSLLQNQGAYEKAVHESHQRTEIQGGWDKVVVTRVTKPENKWMEGIDMASIARRLGKKRQKPQLTFLSKKECG